MRIIYKILYTIVSNLPRKKIKILKFKIIIFESVRVFFAKKILLKSGKKINIGRKVVIGDKVELGENSGIGCNCKIASFTCIGKNVMFGPECLTYTANHETSRLDIPMRDQGVTEVAPIIIEDDIWIGARAIILPGVRIGRGSIVGAGCVVTKNVEEYSIIVGNPGRVIRKRGEFK